MADEQAPNEQTHHLRSDSTTCKRKRPEEKDDNGENGTPRSPKRRQQKEECDLSLRENKRGAQQDLDVKQDGEARKRCSKRANRNISQQALREMLRKALDTGSLAGLHPTASVVGNSMVINSVRVEVYNNLSALLLDRSIPAPRNLKLDFLRRTPNPQSDRSHQARHGRLHVTMPGFLHEEFKKFSTHVSMQMTAQNFLPHILDPEANIIDIGGPRMKVAREGINRNVESDSALAIQRRDRPFLVVECAHSQTAKDVRSKARDYILHDTTYPVRFVVVIYIDTPLSRVPKRSNEANQTTENEGRVEDKPVLTPQDTVRVTVFVPLVTPTDDGDHVSLGTAIDGLEVFPKSATENDFFIIKWSDVNCGLWQDFRTRYQLPADSCEPMCKISVAYLSIVAQRLATPPLLTPSPPVTPTTSTKRRRIMVATPPSSSPKQASSESDMSSKEERRIDPDYEPSSE